MGNIRYPVCGRHSRRPTLDWSSPGRKTVMRYPTRASEHVHRRLRPRLRPCQPTRTAAVCDTARWRASKALESIIRQGCDAHPRQTRPARYASAGAPRAVCSTVRHAHRHLSGITTHMGRDGMARRRASGVEPDPVRLQEAVRYFPNVTRQASRGLGQALLPIRQK